MANLVTPPPGLKHFDDIVLVVGDLDAWQKAGRMIPAIAGFHFAAFADVTDDLLRVIAPDLVLSALMGDEYDVIELARRLDFLAFVGRYRALTRHLPNPQLVLNEVRAAAPGIDFDLFDVDRDSLK